MSSPGLRADPFSTREAVAGETPARRATSVRVLAATASPGLVRARRLKHIMAVQTTAGKRLPRGSAPCIMEAVGMRFPNQLDYLAHSPWRTHGLRNKDNP